MRIVIESKEYGFQVVEEVDGEKKELVRVENRPTAVYVSISSAGTSVPKFEFLRKLSNALIDFSFPS